MSSSRNISNDNTEEQERLAFLRGIGALPQENRTSITRTSTSLSPDIRQMLGLPSLPQNVFGKRASTPIQKPISSGQIFSQETPQYPPPIIDFIWLGGPIPEKYLRSILKLKQVSEIDPKNEKKTENAPPIKNFSITIWTDHKSNIYSTLNKLSINTDLSISNKKNEYFGINIKSIDKFIDQLKTSDDPYWHELIDTQILDTNNGVFCTKKQTRAAVFELCVFRPQTDTEYGNIRTPIPAVSGH